MKFITDRIEWTEAMKAYAKEQIAKKLKTAAIDSEQAEISLAKIKPDKVKVTIAVEAYRAQAIDKDFYTCVLAALTKLKSIIRKSAKKSIDIKRKIIEEALSSPKESYATLVTKEKLFILEPITLDLAVESFEKTDYGFYIFKDTDDQNTVTVLYRKADSTYGLIRCR